MGDIAGQIAGATMTVFGLFATLIVVVVIGLFAATNPALYRNGLVKLLPVQHRPRAEETLSTMGYALRWWLLGQLISILLLGIVSSLGLLLLGVEVWLGFGVLVGLFTFVPFLGPILAGIPVVLIGFAEGVQTGLAVLAFYLVLQNIEGNVLIPMIQQRAISLPPALLITTQVLLARSLVQAGLSSPLLWPSLDWSQSIFFTSRMSWAIVVQRLEAGLAFAGWAGDLGLMVQIEAAGEQVQGISTAFCRHIRELALLLR